MGTLHVTRRLAGHGLYKVRNFKDILKCLQQHDQPVELAASRLWLNPGRRPRGDAEAVLAAVASVHALLESAEEERTMLVAKNGSLQHRIRQVELHTELQVTRFVNSDTSSKLQLSERAKEESQCCWPIACCSAA